MTPHLQTQKNKFKKLWFFPYQNGTLYNFKQKNYKLIFFKIIVFWYHWLKILSQQIPLCIAIPRAVSNTECHRNAVLHWKITLHLAKAIKCIFHKTKSEANTKHSFSIFCWERKDLRSFVSNFCSTLKASRDDQLTQNQFNSHSQIELYF